jgi:hypothetical protein
MASVRDDGSVGGRPARVGPQAARGEVLLRRRVVAEMLSVSPRQVDRLAKIGVLPKARPWTHGVSRAPGFLASEVQRFLLERRVEVEGDVG